jgi:hypothetical protein
MPQKVKVSFDGQIIAALIVHYVLKLIKLHFAATCNSVEQKFVAECFRTMIRLVLVARSAGCVNDIDFNENAFTHANTLKRAVTNDLILE